MTAKVIGIDEARPHLSGPARCLDCKHEWVAVAPVGTWCMTCPACGADKAARFSKGEAVPLGPCVDPNRKKRKAEAKEKKAARRKFASEGLDKVGRGFAQMLADYRAAQDEHTEMWRELKKQILRDAHSLAQSGFLNEKDTTEPANAVEDIRQIRESEKSR